MLFMRKSEEQEKIEKKLNLCNTGSRRDSKARTKKYQDFEQVSESTDRVQSIASSKLMMAPLSVQDKASQRFD